MTLVLFELALVLFAVRPDQVTISVHLIVQPLTLILLLVAPNVGSLPLDLVHLELSIVDRAVSESQLPLPILLALVVLSLVHCTVRPRLQAEPMLLVVSPRAHILGSVRVRVGTVTIGFVVNPVALVNIAVRVVQLTSSICLSVAPLALVATPIEPLLLALTVADPIEPLALIDGSTVQIDRLAQLPHILGEAVSLEWRRLPACILVVAEHVWIVLVATFAHHTFHVGSSADHLTGSPIVLVGAKGLRHRILVDSLDGVCCTVTLSCAVREQTRAVSHILIKLFKLKPIIFFNVRQAIN